MIDLNKKQLDSIQSILFDYSPKYEVRIFGSRVNGTSKPFSDIDIALYGKQKLEWQELERIKQKFSESNLPFLVDVMNWEDLSESMRKSIEQNGYETLR